MTLLRRGYRLALVALIAMTFTVGLAGRTTANPPRQQVQGEVVAPSGPRMVGPVWAGACDFVGATSEWATRTTPTLFRIAVGPSTRGRAFELIPSTPSDLDIAFVARSGHSYFETRGTTGETGIVPADASEAYVCLVSGAKAGFTYTAY